VIEWDTQCSRFEFLHRLIGEALALRRTRISLDLLEALVPSHRSDLVRGRACLRERRGARLAQAMGGAVMQVRLVTPVAHRVPEAGGRERLSIIGDQKCQVFRHSLDASALPRHSTISGMQATRKINLNLL